MLTGPELLDERAKEMMRELITATGADRETLLALLKENRARRRKITATTEDGVNSAAYNHRAVGSSQ